MEIKPEYLEGLWNDLLSRQPELILAAYDSLDTTSQIAVFDHLKHMANDAGWQDEQRDSALIALQVLEGRSQQGK